MSNYPYAQPYQPMSPGQMQYQTGMGMMQTPYNGQNGYQQPMQPPVQYQPMNYQQQPVQPAQQPKSSIIGVTCREEVLAAQIPFDPAVKSYFADLGHGMIYLKQFNQNTGSADVYEFQRVISQPIQEQNRTAADTEQLARLEQKVDGLMEQMALLTQPKQPAKRKEESA